MESAYLAGLMFVLLLHWGSQGHTQSYLSISVAAAFSVKRGLDFLIDKQNTECNTQHFCLALLNFIKK